MKYIIIKQRPTYYRAFQERTLPGLSQLCILSMIVVLIGGGAALLWASQQGQQGSRAAGDVSVVGPLTLSAATVDAIFARVGSPMAGTGKLVEQASHQTNIDDAFALGVWWTETNDGEAGVGLADRNPGSVRGSVGYPSAFDGYTIYPSYTAAIIYWFNMLRNNYVEGRGLSTVYTIARPYVGTTSYPLWAGKVINLMYSYRGIAPPLSATATSTPRPKPAINPSAVAANLTRQYKQHQLTQLLRSRSDSGSSLLAGQGQAQEPGQQYYLDTSQANSPSALAPPVNLAIVLFGLLAALAIALYSFKLKAAVQFSSPSLPLSPVVAAPSTDNLPLLPLFSTLPVQGSFTRDDGFVPLTDDLPVLPAQVFALSGSGFISQKRAREAFPRRVTLLPPQSEARTVVTAGAGIGGSTRFGGLLSQYGQNNSNPSI